MKALKSLFGNKFQEYASFINAFDELRGHGVEIIDNDSKAYSRAFQTFIKSQPDNEGALTTIMQNGESTIKIHQHMFNAASILPKELEILKTYNSKFQKSKSDLNELESNMNKAKVAAEKADEILEKTRIKGIQAEIGKCEQRSDIAHQKADSLQKSFDDATSRFSQSTDEYRNNFIETLTKTLATLVTDKQSAIRELAPIAQEISAAAVNFKMDEDTSIQRLEEKLVELDNEVIE